MRADPNLKSDFARRLRSLLAQAGHTLDAVPLARIITGHAGYSIQAQTVSNWINGVQLPQRGNLLALAAWLGTTPDALTEGTPILHFAPSKIDDVDTAQLVEHFQLLDAYGRRMVLAMVSAAVRLRGL